MKVAVLMGGRSSEREISFRTGRGIAQALRNLGHEVAAIDTATGRMLPAGDEEKGAPPSTEIENTPGAEVAVANATALRAAEVVFVALHGGEGEDGTIQALLELAGKPYTGSGVMASAIAIDKAMSKRLFEHAGIPTPRWRLLAAGPGLPREIDLSALGGLPVVVKPNREGSTVGLTIVTAAADLPGALELAARYDPDVLVEQFIPGRELTVAVMGDEALPIVEIRPRSGIYDYEAKYTAGRSEYFCPAELPEPLAARIRELGRRAAQVLACRGVSRADFRLDPDEVPWCLEVNTVPGMTPTSLVPMAARAAGMSYDQVVQRMIDLAVAEWQRRRGRLPTPGASARV